MHRIFLLNFISSPSLNLKILHIPFYEPLHAFLYLNMRGIVQIPDQVIHIRPCSRDIYNSSYNIIYICEIPFHLSVIIDIDRPLFKNSLCKDEQRHVRSSPWAIDSKKSEPGGWQAIEMAICMRHRFIRLLCGRIDSYGMIDIVMGRKGV